MTLSERRFFPKLSYKNSLFAKSQNIWRPRSLSELTPY